MQITAFTDERMKILYTLSFMSRKMIQVWAVNKPSMALANMSTFNTLEGLLMSIQKTFCDPDRERTACTRLHVLKMMPGITAEEYMANFEMLSRRTSFNEAAL